MLTFKIAGRDAIPVRAIPFAAGGSFDAHQIIDVFYDPESWAVGPDTAAGESMGAPPKAFRVGADGKVVPTAATSWGLTSQNARYRGEGAPDAPEQLGLLPAGVFVWVDEFEPFYKAFARNREQVRPAPAGAFGWDPNTALSNYAAKLVFESIPNGAVRPRREEVNSRAQHLRELEVEIDESCRHLIPVSDWNKFHTWPPVGGLRHLIFFGKSNGFDSVVRRIGRRVLIDEAAFFAWADRQGRSAMTADTQKTPEQLANASANSPPFRARRGERPARTPPVPMNGRGSS